MFVLKIRIFQVLHPLGLGNCSVSLEFGSFVKKHPCVIGTHLTSHSCSIHTLPYAHCSVLCTVSFVEHVPNFRVIAFLPWQNLHPSTIEVLNKRALLYFLNRPVFFNMHLEIESGACSTLH